MTSARILLQQDIDRIQRRLDEASRPPWVWLDEQNHNGHWLIGTASGLLYVRSTEPCVEANYRFIAAAHQDTSILLAEVARLQAIIHGTVMDKDSVAFDLPFPSEYDLHNIEKRFKDAAPGPWEHIYVEWGHLRWINQADDGTIQLSSDRRTGPRIEGDNDFIAHAREDIPSLYLTMRHLE